MNVALVGSNFAIKGYLPVIKKIRQVFSQDTLVDN